MSEEKRIEIGKLVRIRHQTETLDRSLGIVAVHDFTGCTGQQFDYGIRIEGIEEVVGMFAWEVTELDGRKLVTPEQVAALVKEMVSKGYDQMKARTLTTIEVALGQSNLGDKPIGRQITYALDDAKRVMMDVLARVAPEITAEMLSEAGEARRKAEDAASYERQTERLEEEAEELRSRLSWVERRIKETKGRATRQEIFFTIQRATDENLPQIQEAVVRSIQRVSRGTV